MDRPPPTLDLDLPCARCRYNLRALPSAGRCPECGTPAALSWMRRLPPGWSRAYARRLHVGARLTQVGGLAAAACGCVCCGTDGVTALVYLPGAVAWAGCWTVAAAAPDDDPARGRAGRAACRALLLAAGVAALIDVGRAAGAGAAMSRLGLPVVPPALGAAVAGLAMMGAYTLAVAQLGRVVARIEPRVEVHTQGVLMMTLAAAVVGGLAAAAAAASLVSGSGIAGLATGIALAIVGPGWLITHAVFFDRVAAALGARLASVSD